MSTNTWKIRYADSVVKEDIPKIGRISAKRIRKAIEQKLLYDPIHFGKPLRYSLTGQRSLRVGDYRVLYELNFDNLLVSVTAIGHRKNIYDT